MFKKQNGLHRCSVFVHLLLPQYKIMLEVASRILEALNNPTVPFNIDLDYGGSVTVNDGSVKIESTSLAGKTNKVVMSKDQILTWMRKKNNIDQGISSLWDVINTEKVK